MLFRSALIANLRLGGIFVCDTDLFQKDVTKLLNSNISPFYKQIKQLTRVFPVYFREIGAEGRLREVTTSLDELSCRKDRLIHYLRKQIHTESNNTHVELTKKIIQFWYDSDLTPLETVLPANVLESIDLEGEWFIHVHEITSGLCSKKGVTPGELLNMDVGELEGELENIIEGNARDKKRILYLIELYGLILEKYSLEPGNIISCLKGCRLFSDDDIECLSENLDKNDAQSALTGIFEIGRASCRERV